jgi:hypothetical protein
LVSNKGGGQAEGGLHTLGLAGLLRSVEAAWNVCHSPSDSSGYVPAMIVQLVSATTIDAMAGSAIARTKNDVAQTVRRAAAI